MATSAGLTVGIVSLWHNCPELLPYFTELVENAAEWDRLVMVSNASTDENVQNYIGALEYLVGKCKRSVDLTVRRENSVLHGWNTGMAQLDTDIVISMANDVALVDKRWLEWATDGMRPGLIQGPLTSEKFVQYVDGCCSVYMREDWLKLGGLDAEYYLHPGYWSDVDIAWRATQMGMQVRQTISGIRHMVNYTSARVLSAEGWGRTQENARRLVARIREADSKCDV